MLCDEDRCERQATETVAPPKGPMLNVCERHADDLVAHGGTRLARVHEVEPASWQLPTPALEADHAAMLDSADPAASAEWQAGWKAGKAAAAPYDSRPDTWEHISQVQGLLLLMQHDTAMRAYVHDWSKLVPPEVETFDLFTPRLQDPDAGYGTPAYAANLAAMAPALAHHYAVHDHHPEHFGPPSSTGVNGTQHHGIFDMAAPQLLEMACDMIAASRRRPDGNVMTSLPAHAAKHGYAGTALERTVRLTVLYVLKAEGDSRPPEES